MNMEIDPPKLQVEEHQIKDDDLFKAADSGDSSIFQSLSQSQLLKSLSLRNEDGRSLLHVASSSGHTEVVRILSASDPSVSGINSTDEEGWAPIHSAASSGRVEIVENLLSRAPPSVQPETAKKKRGTSFSIKEDVFLVTAWLNTSMDSVHGNDKNKNTFWGRVRQYYYQYKTFASERNERSLQQRWATIQHATNKFGQCYAQIEDLRSSEKNETDVIADAKSLYESTHGKKFTLEHCWHILRRHPKWFDEVSKQKPPQRGKGLHSSPGMSSPITPLTPGTPINLAMDDAPNTGFVHRPPGQNAEKQKQRAIEENESTLGTPIDLGTDDVPDTGFVQRPPARNVEKRKQRATEDNGIPSHVMADLIKEMVEGRKKAETAYMELLEEKKIASCRRLEIMEKQLEMELEKHKLEVEKQRNEAEKQRVDRLAYEERIVMMDTSGMPLDAQQYYSKLKKKILRGENYDVRIYGCSGEDFYQI